MNRRFISTHPYHLVDVSPWPILKSFGLLSGALALVNWITLGGGGIALPLLITCNII